MAELSAQTIARFLAATPRRPENVAFIGRGDSLFAGNAKYLFLHFATSRPDIKPCYLTLNRQVFKELQAAGLPTALFPEEPALRALAGAQVVVVDDFHYRLHGMELFTKGAKIVQLWHGVGFKKIGFLEAASTINLDQEKREYLRRMYSGYDAVISTSPFYTKNLFETSFAAEEIWETGYPRNDVLLRRLDKYDLLGSDPKLYASLRTMHNELCTCLYAPTFRDDQGDPFQHGALDLASLSEFLEQQCIALFIKMHQFSKRYDVKNLPNVHIIPNELDIYPLLPCFSCMITDYSSIYMDYLLLQRPVIFFPYDQEDYYLRLREFQFDYNDMTPGPKCMTQKELHQALQQAAAGAADWKQQRQSVRDMAFCFHDADASSRVAENVERLAWNT